MNIILRSLKDKWPFHYLWKTLFKLRTDFLFKYNIKAIPNSIFKKVFRRDINWNNPVNLVEKIYWLQIHSDITLWTKCADKFLVREFVEERGCGNILNDLYGKWDNANDIDWDSLPQSFVLKSNNGCGQVILVKSKDKLNIPETIQELNGWLNSKYGYADFQLHYTKIQPCIIAEKLFINKSDENKSLIDYKIWCFNGVPECVLIVYNRTKDGYELTSYDMDWNNISEKSFKKGNPHVNGTGIPKPASFEQMVESAKKLSKGFPEVRVDFYDIDGQAVFGEMTFTTGFGYYSDEYYDHLGSKIDLSIVKKNNYLNTPGL